MKERCGREWPQRSFWCSLGEIRRWKYTPKQLNNQQRGQHRRLGNTHGARDDLVEASCVSFASVQARKLNHYAASPLPTKPSGFAGSPRRASEKRTVGSLGRLHHAAQSVWTHNVRPAHKWSKHAPQTVEIHYADIGCMENRQTAKPEQHKEIPKVS